MTSRDTVRVGAVLVLVMGLVVMGLGWLLWPGTGGGDVRVARGTVVRAVHCGPSDARDGLRVELLDGRAVPAWLDGCGHRLGEVLTVEVPDPLPAGDVVARLPGTGVPAATVETQRIGAVGVAVAGIAGALLAWRLRGHRS
ncbi:MAG TPA: hypothetical protein VK887_01845 [Pseudonocardiaceae bacterium]|nr:hypothetical protein [Pseudonocardiaceae bacterium]